MLVVRFPRSFYMKGKNYKALWFSLSSISITEVTIHLLTPKHTTNIELRIVSCRKVRLKKKY